MGWYPKKLTSRVFPARFATHPGLRGLGRRWQAAWAALRQQCRAPLFADEETTRQARLLHPLILVNIAGAALGLALLALFGALSGRAAAVLLGGLLAGLLLQRWMRRGRVQAAGTGAAILALILATALMLLLRSGESAMSAVFLLVVVISGIALRLPGLLAVLAAALLNVAFLHYARLAGLPGAERAPVENPNDWLVVAVVILGLSVFAWQVRITITQGLARLRQELAARARVQEELRRARDFYQGVVNGVDDPVMIKDERGRWVLINDQACALFHIQREQWLGRTDYELVPPERAEMFAALDRQVLAGSGPVTLNESLPTEPRSGQPPRALITKKSLIIDPLTGERFIASVTRDISERKQIEVELEAARAGLEARVAEQTAALRAINDSLHGSMQDLQHFMDVNPGLVFLMSEEGRLLRWNRSFQLLLGYSAEEVALLNARRLVRLSERRAVLAAYQESRASGRVSLEVPVITKDGRELPMLVSGSAYTDEDGRRLFIGVGIDLSDRLAAQAALDESRSRYRALIDGIPDAIVVIDTDGSLLFSNQAMSALVDTSLLAEPYGEQQSGFGRVLHPDDADPVTRAFDSFADGDLQASDAFECRLFDREGQLRWFSVRFSRIQYQGRPAVQVLGHEISGQIRAQEALRLSEERYALAAKGANDGLWDIDLPARRMYLSLRLREMVGDRHLPEYLPYDWWFERIHPDDIDRAVLEIETHLRQPNLLTPHFETEFRMRAPDGSYRWLAMRGVAVHNAEGKPVRAAGSIADITERKRVEAQLLHDAFHDTLTGLPNRALLSDRISQAIFQRQRHPKTTFAVLFMDLDRFKDINDSHGHPTGDRLLVAVAQRVQGCVRACDTLARLGGDEFVILQTGVSSAAEGILLAERVQAALTQPFDLGGFELITSTSIGIVLGDSTHIEPQDLLRDADIAMYRAKELGRARHQVFDASMRGRVYQRMRTEADLRLALQNHEFEVFFHPIYTTQGGEFYGFEALARWRHPQRGLVPPAEFIPLAEEIGLIIPLDRWVLRQACRTVRRWQVWSGLPIKVSVNLSGKQFNQPDLVENIAAALKETGLPATSLMLEITESAVMENISMSIETMRSIQNLGVQVEIDDFGTGFSSLTYLMQLPVSTLKIDRSFTTQILTDTRKSEIVDTVIRLAHNLKMRVVAEGVEGADQLNALKGMRCDYAQGYYFAQPLDAQSAEAYLVRKVLNSRRG